MLLLGKVREIESLQPRVPALARASPAACLTQHRGIFTSPCLVGKAEMQKDDHLFFFL